MVPMRMLEVWGWVQSPEKWVTNSVAKLVMLVPCCLPDTARHLHFYMSMCMCDVCGVRDQRST